ncbi:MAG TPA: NAD-dependent epimerase/dehydratase family protein [Actinomycetes bacterium]
MTTSTVGPGRLPDQAEPCQAPASDRGDGPAGGVEHVTASGGALSSREKHHAEGTTMRVFVAGATGALGRHLVPGLVAAGHEVTATTRTPGKVAQLRQAGAEPVVVDGLDREAVIAAVLAAGPEVIVHQMTALAGMRSLRKPDHQFAATNELRTRGTDNLLAAAARAGTRRVIAQSNIAANERSGGPVKTEEDPLDPRPVRSAARGLAAIKHVEKAVPLTAPEGIVLRYGSFYGPGASEILLDSVRKRQVPVIGGGTGIWSFIEITDAHLHSARVRRETYVGDWLPEPVVVPADGPGPAEHAELADSLSMAFLVLLEALSPVERAVFMLREVFEYGYPDVARIPASDTQQLGAGPRGPRLRPVAQHLQGGDHPAAPTGVKAHRHRLHPVTTPHDRDGVGKPGRALLAVHADQRVAGRERPAPPSDRPLQHRPQLRRAHPLELADAAAASLDLQQRHGDPAGDRRRGWQADPRAAATAHADDGGDAPTVTGFRQEARHRHAHHSPGCYSLLLFASHWLSITWGEADRGWLCTGWAGHGTGRCAFRRRPGSAGSRRGWGDRAPATIGA